MVFSIELPGRFKYMLWILVKCSKDGATCWPSIPFLEHKSGLKRNAVKSAIEGLDKDYHLISRQYRVGDSILYFFNLELIAKLAAKGLEKTKIWRDEKDERLKLSRQNFTKSRDSKIEDSGSVLPSVSDLAPNLESTRGVDFTLFRRSGEESAATLDCTAPASDNAPHADFHPDAEHRPLSSSITTVR